MSKTTRQERRELVACALGWSALYVLMALTGEESWLLTGGLVAFIFTALGVSLVVGNRHNAATLKEEKQAALRARASKTLQKAGVTEEELQSRTYLAFGQLVTKEEFADIKRRLSEVKDEPPKVIAPPVSAGGPPPWVILPGTGSRAQWELLKQEVFGLYDTPNTGDYRPAGQDELSAMLLETLLAQVEARGGLPGFVPSYRWFMSPEWLLEVRKLKAKDGRPLWEPHYRRPGQRAHEDYLFGYRITVGEEFGIPDLREAQ